MRVVVIASDKVTANMMSEHAREWGIEVFSIEVEDRLLHDFRDRSAAASRRGDERWQEYLELNRVDFVIVALATTAVAPTVFRYVRSAHRVPVLLGDHIHLYSLLRLLAPMAS